MSAARFDLKTVDAGRFWCERTDAGVMLRGSADDQREGEAVVPIALDELRNLLVWADDESTVTAVFTGPMANEIRKGAQELAITEEMFVWHAVKMFMDVGSASH